MQTSLVNHQGQSTMNNRPSHQICQHWLLWLAHKFDISNQCF